MSPRTVALILAALIAIPAVATLVGAHTIGGPQITGGSNGLGGASSTTTPPSAGYTGPGAVPYINFFLGTWLYGTASATPIGHQYPLAMKGSGDWIVWQDALRGDVYAYNIPAGTGQFVGSDVGTQRNPDVSDDVAVWEETRSGHTPDVWAQFLLTGETRDLSAGAKGNHQHPSIDGDIVAWEDTRNGNTDIWGYNLSNKTQFPVFVGPDKESDPLVLGHTVYFRTYRFNVWDVMAADVDTGDVRQLTQDIAMQSAPFSNGHDVLWLTETPTAWSLERFDPATQKVTRTSLKFQDTTPIAVAGDNIVYAQRVDQYRELVGENLTSGNAQHVSGNIVLTTEPYLNDRTLYAPVYTANGTTLLSVDLSPFAFAKRPELDLSYPRNGVPWLGPIQARGTLVASAAFSSPATFTYRLDDGAPTAIPTDATGGFAFPLDPRGVASGTHTLTIRATYREGPPLEQSVNMFIPATGNQVDLQKAGEQFHAARAAAVLDAWFVQNPASWFVIVIVVLVLALLAIRLWYFLKPKRHRVRIEYVAQDDA